MEPNPDFASPCGLYCGVCAVYMAYRDDFAGHSISTWGGHRKMDAGWASTICLSGVRQ